MRYLGRLECSVTTISFALIDFSLEFDETISLLCKLRIYETSSQNGTKETIR